MQADLKVFMRFGLPAGAGVPTCWTTQGPSGLKSVVALSGREVKKQLDALLTDVRPVVVKVGMLPSGEVVRAVARALGPLAAKKIPIVIDPVLVSSSGKRVLPTKDVAVFMRQLVPLATVITPNIDEAAELSGRSVSGVRKHTETVIKELRRAGARNVLIKGGHLSTKEAVDILGTPDEFIMFSLPRVPRRRSVHGTGCALASAIAALLAYGLSVEDAVEAAKHYVHGAIESSRRVGRGSRMLAFEAPIENEAQMLGGT
jgi:hydroxymethylpyrimidine/phosphomethylpyrimidine kinase